MMRLSKVSLMIAVCLGAAAMFGCGGGDKPQAGSTGGPGATAAERGKYLLASEPAGARPVKDVRAAAKDGEDVVILGHIGGDPKPWVEGRAAFWIVDPSVKPCPPDEGCPTPWDCCCLPKEELIKVVATVKIVDATGQTVPVDARMLLGVKESQTVVVKGKAKRDDQGNLTVLADCLFVRP
jgi:hypothetical protein